MATAQHLSSGSINVAVIRDAARRELLDCLDRCEGTKALVWDDGLTGPFGLIAEYTLLKDHNVTKMVLIQSDPVPAGSVQHVVFLCRPLIHLMDRVAEFIKRDDHPGTSKEYSIFFVPRKTLVCERRLQDLGIMGTFANIDDYSLDIFPFDSDVLSMEHSMAFRESYLEGDLTSMFYVAKAIMLIQTLYGIIPHIYGKGHCARHVADMVLRMRREAPRSLTSQPPQFDTLLLLDRNIDLLSPLITQLTYEGLIDEFFGIQNTNCKLPADKFIDPNEAKGSEQGAMASTSTQKTVTLNSAEELFAELRDLNYHAVGPLLNRRAKHVKEAFEERHDAKTVGQIKQFVTRLPHIQASRQSLSTHTSIAELLKQKITDSSFMNSLHMEQELFQGVDTDKIHPYIEQLIAQQSSLVKVLRLMCIQCIVNNGFKQKVYDFYRKEILQTYGFEHMRTLQRLEQAGLLRLSGVRTYNAVRKTLRLTVDEVNEQNPTDIAYVHSGYAPLTVRLAQYLNRPEKWRGLEEAMKLLPGPIIDDVQSLPSGMEKGRQNLAAVGSYDNPRIVLIFFLGGCTYAEISALRFLSQQEEGQTEYVIATTKLINGSNWLQTMID
ncbi:vacuolar protein sorting-associated protein 33A-like [Corticium candelabrum]|uniref:vacuolar protein sorting-associated protein 33A-like n=1 Tax=Corticium candelabrum TaxID=121492 RepID=UPI002E253C9C|nr:vacuolar protein sorting-associated protein 33A-like [Corticium candelabrum]